MYDVITIGTAVRDFFLKISGGFETEDKNLPARQFPRGRIICLPLATKVETKEMAVFTGGGAANSAVTFSRQGFKTATIISIGDDEAGKEIIRDLEKEKIAVLAEKSRLPTGVSHVLLSPSGERTILVFRGASAMPRSVSLPLAKWAYITPGGTTPSTMNKIFSHLTKKGTFIAFNPSRKYISLGAGLKKTLSRCRVVILNREEASFLTGIRAENEKELFGKLDELVKGIVVMTDGGNGVIVSDGGRIYRSGIFREKKLIDRTGAGDAFGSGFVAGLMRKSKESQEEMIKYAIRLGTANAASVVENLGASFGVLTESAFKKALRWRKLPIFVSEV